MVVLTLVLALFLLAYIGNIFDNLEEKLISKVVETDARIKREESIMTNKK